MRSLLLPFVVAVALAHRGTADELVQCGDDGPVHTLGAGVAIGPAFGYSEQAAIAALWAQVCPERCADCELPGCWYGITWRGGIAPLTDADELATVPPIWIATGQSGAGVQGQVNCTTCPD